MPYTMNMDPPHRDSTDPLMRIETARRELARTDVHPRVARALVVVFLAAITLAPLTQLAFDPSLLTRMLTTVLRGLAPEPRDVNTPLFGVVLDRNRALLASIEEVNNLVADESLATRFARPTVQVALSSVGAGTSQVHHGARDWLFFAPDLTYVTGPGFLEPRRLRHRASEGNTLVTAPHPDPRPALYDLRAQLARRDIALVVMPTPVKPSVDWEFLGHPKRVPGHLPTNTSYRVLVDELRHHGLLVFDVAEELHAAKQRIDHPLYLATDTHWRPETVELVATRLTDFLAEHTLLTDEHTSSYRARRVSVTGHGDTARLLGLPADWSMFGPETVKPRQVTSDDGRLWRPDPTADILLLGDSFTNVYSLEAMGWGTGAGLAAQLSFVLQQPVDRMAQNADGAFASRELLANALRRGRDRLADKRVVILQFAARQLGLGDWRPVDLSASSPRSSPTSFVRPTDGGPLEVQGTIRDIGLIPRPGSVPYKDHIVGVHVTDITTETSAGAVDGTELVVYLWSMRDDELTTISQYRVGDAVRLRLEPWANVADALDGINRAEVTDPSARLSEPWWGQLRAEGSP